MSTDTNYQCWGKSVAVDLHGCSLKPLTNPGAIEAFVQKVIKKIGMVAHGPCYVERFGQGALEGYSALQFIETSSITVHCDEISLRCFVDVFSCKDFDHKIVETFAKEFFGATHTKATVLER